MLETLPLQGAGRLELESWHRKSSGISESFSSAMNSILLSRWKGEQPKTILLTSPEVGDGKTTVCSNLAIALAQINLRVLLVDADIRRPNLHKIFNIRNEDGLIGLLSSQRPIEEIPADRLGCPTGIPNLLLLPTGDSREFERELLHSSRASELLTRLRREFDVVLLDSPPMAHISDARVLGHLVDGVILVFRAGRTIVDLAVSTRNCLLEDGTPVLGTILNDWDPRASKVYSNCYRKYRHQYFEPVQRPA
jgi:capsular exopolysaccharide synthesis family protein